MTTIKPATPLPHIGPTVRLRMQNEAGTPVTWRVWRDGRHPAAWVLLDHLGVERTLSVSWDKSVPHIKTIAENHALTFLQEIS